MDSNGLQKYIEEYGEGHRGETPTYWKVGVFRWEDGLPSVKSKEYFGYEWEANGAFYDARYDGKYADAPADDAYLVGMWEIMDGDESNPANWKIAQCGARIVLPIKAVYAEGILIGHKQFEYRKRMPKRPISQIVIYETASMGMVVGTVDVCGVLEGEPGELYKKTSHAAGIGKEDYDEYFRGCEKAYAFSLDTPVRFDHPVPIETYGLKCAPQSFAYVKEEGK